MWEAQEKESFTGADLVFPVMHWVQELQVVLVLRALKHLKDTRHDQLFIYKQKYSTNTKWYFPNISFKKTDVSPLVENIG